MKALSKRNKTERGRKRRRKRIKGGNRGWGKRKSEKKEEERKEGRKEGKARPVGGQEEEPPRIWNLQMALAPPTGKATLQRV